MNLEYVRFSTVDLQDPFFDSLKEDYAEFTNWFEKKSEESAYVFSSESGSIDGFLYLKIENESLDDVEPKLVAASRLKVGTFKINPHGTRLGERFLKKIFDHAITLKVEEIYVTVFEKHDALVKLFEKYGFSARATKKTANGAELVLLKDMSYSEGELLKNYPFIKVDECNIFLLSLYPQWHTRLLPDSILNNEDASIVTDISHTNSIHKVYLAAMGGMEVLRPGDVVVVYRTSDNKGPAEYRSVATSVCVIEEYKNISEFESREQFLAYCSPYSVFTNDELETFWSRRKYPHVIRFTYNYALPKRVTRGTMINDLGFDRNSYWGFMQLSSTQLQSVIARGELDEGLIVN